MVSKLPVVQGCWHLATYTMWLAGVSHLSVGHRIEGVMCLNCVLNLGIMRIRTNGGCFLSSWSRQDCLCYFLLNSQQYGKTILFIHTNVFILRKKIRMEAQQNPINLNCLPTQCLRTSRKKKDFKIWVTK